MRARRLAVAALLHLPATAGGADGGHVAGGRRRALAGFGKRLKSRAAAALDSAVRSALAASAGAIRDDVRALRAL
jgi:hypothetical protein